MVSKDLFPTEPVVLVVSPLNALIKDQLSSCEKLGIKATKIEGSELPSLEGIEIVYVSPETLIGNTQIILKPVIWVVSHVTKTSLVVKETRAHAG